MKKGLLICRGAGKLKNIGDYIQSLAGEQFIGNDYCYVERETLNSFKSDEKVKVIMNGWFMWCPENFPPSDDIDPLYISFHISPAIATKLLSEKTLSHLKSYQPIGTRDIGTMELLQSHGIQSYFSGCLTLTLGRNYKAPTTRNDKVYFVDPYFEFGDNYDSNKFVRILHAISHSIKHRKIVSQFSKRFNNYEFTTVIGKISQRLERFMMAASFYNTYKNVFSDEVFIHAEYISHLIDTSVYPSEDDRMDYARQLINKYAKAHYIVTSRIHSALPALGLETPVVFVNADRLQGDSVRAGGRFEGLIELMHEMEWCPRGLKPVSPELKQIIQREGKIHVDTKIGVRMEYKKYSQDMIDRIMKFLE